MKKDEKILMIKLLLKDIRGNWGWEHSNRAGKAYDLSMELYIDTEDKNWLILARCIAQYDGYDGRYFRSKFPYGYEEMEKLYTITETYKDKSEEFKKIVEEYLTYPEYRFEDYKVN